MKINIVSLFTGMFETPFSDSIIKRAREKGLVEMSMHDIRDCTTDRHRTVDDTPYGGGAGMVMMPEPLVQTVESIEREKKSISILMTPQGEPFSQKIAHELVDFDQLLLICGRYEGIDERAREIIADREISIGDYVLSGGEIPAMVLVDAVVRLIPGVLGNDQSIEHESFEEGLLECPQYTRPEVFRGKRVPPVLLSGNHAEIEAWRRREALKRTRVRRPDLLKDLPLTERDEG
ncbi:MAG: tRNA (guanosine(37)-N1)-methyltransferase TrmD [Deltaproteobacteria bacterium]|jgi:tRNA (guanine37-N1)-methyltransferase|nr:tRNA (guanosine(37)-N1)-methyltransferase TrmD [Deltaproteobacteria bacterium]